MGKLQTPPLATSPDPTPSMCSLGSNRLVHGSHSPLGQRHRALRGSPRELGLLRNPVHHRSLPCHTDSSPKETPQGGRRAGRTQNYQNDHVIHLRLLLGFLRAGVWSGSLWCYKTWLLRSFLRPAVRSRSLWCYKTWFLTSPINYSIIN